MIEFLRTGDIQLYYLFIYFGTFLVGMWNLCNIKKYKAIPGRFSEKIISFTKSKSKNFPIETILAFFTLVILVLFQYILAGNYNTWFGKMLNMGPNYFGTALIGPFFVAAVCLIFGIDIVRAYDLLAPSYALGLVSVKFGCFCSGCCRGIPWEHGLYNFATDCSEVPVQLIEMGCALLIFITLVLISKKAKTGTLFPIYLILYCATRFCSEFLRHEDDVVGNLKLYHLCCLGGLAVGIIFLLIALFAGDRITKLFTWRYGVFDILRNMATEINYSYHKAKKKILKKDKNVVHHKKKKKKK